MAFQCPVCKHKQYSLYATTRETTETGEYKTNTFYKCDRCSVVFGDPHKFFTGGRNNPYGGVIPGQLSGQLL